MTTAYPVGLDDFVNPTPADKLGTPAVLHTDQHSNANDAIEALERKVGIDGSSDPDSLDYKVAHATGGAPFQTDLPADIGASAVTGTSGSVPHADHVHGGVHGIFSLPNAALTGDVELVAGTNISITQTSGSLTITNTMGTGGITFDSASPQDVGSAAIVGTSGSPPHGDHVHRGVRGIFVASNSAQFGDIELVGQNGMTITQSSGSFTLSQDLSGYVPTSRLISTSAPLAGGGDLSANRTISIPQASHIADGYLSAADWTSFNDKPGGLTPFQTDTPANVGDAPLTGTSGSVPHSDHVHEGVHGVFVEPNAVLTGNIALVAGTNISIAQTSGSLTITNTMAAGGVLFDPANPQDVGTSPSVGTSGSPPHADHVHRGVSAILTPPNAAAYGALELLGSGDISVTQTSGSFTIGATSGSFLPQIHDINGVYHTGTPLRPDKGGTGVDNGANLLTIPATGTAVLTDRNINASAPLSGGGNLSADRTIAIPQANHTVDGYLSAADWTIFNDKQGNLTPFQTDAPADVSAVATTGTSGSVPHADHAHRGVGGIFVAPNSSVYGQVALAGSGDISVTQSSGSFTIEATSGSFLPQTHDINGGYHSNFPLRTDRGGLGTSVVPTAGAIPIGRSDGVYVPNHLTAGENIVISNSSGSVGVSVPYGAGFVTSFLLMGG